jgi:hypothetical protein
VIVTDSLFIGELTADRRLDLDITPILDDVGVSNDDVITPVWPFPRKLRGGNCTGRGSSLLALSVVDGNIDD